MNGLETLIIGLMIAIPQQTAPTIEPDRSTECLALNMYHEARGQGIAGELAVTAVVLNRVNDLPFIDITGGATHYHADYVSPAWAKTKTKTVEIQDHIFYRWEK